MPAPTTPASSPGVFRADDGCYARTPAGTFLRVNPAPDAPEDWASGAARAAAQHAARRRDESAPAAPGVIILRDATGLDPAVSPAAHLHELLTHQGRTIRSQQATIAQEPDAERPLLVTFRPAPPIPDPDPAGQEGTAAATALQHHDLLDIHAEGAQWFLHPLRLTPSDPAPEQVLRRRLAATPAHRALASWWRLAADALAGGPAEEVLHRTPHEPSPTAAAIVAWHAAQVIEAWTRGPDVADAPTPRRRLTIADTHTMEVTHHPVLPHPIPHGRPPEGLRR